MNAIRFEVPGIPVAKAKKMAVFGGHARGFIDTKTRSFQGDVRFAACAVRPDAPFTGPVTLSLVAVFPRPKRLEERVKRTGALKCGCEGRIPHGQKPDADNLAKAVCDGVNASGVWGDDSQVAMLTVQKVYAAIGELPHVEVVVAAMGAA